MKAAILNGMNEDNPCLKNIHDVVIAMLQAAQVKTQTFFLREMDIASCNGCFGCWIKTPGVCVINDIARDIGRAFIQSDLLVCLTPVVFGGYSSQLKKALDRNIGLVSPFFLTVNGETHHQLRYEKYPRLLIIGALSPPDEESRKIFLNLVERNAINFHAPAFAGEVFFNYPEKEEIHLRIKTLLEKVGVSQ